MAELRRLDSSPSPDAAGRDVEIDALLVDGLDRYFNGRYDEAIHVWTRVLFLDRSHARARAYIDRARTALAERQRRSDELLATTGQLLDRGETEAARHLLAEAVATSGDDEHASALRSRLERLERAAAGAGPMDRLPPRIDVVPGWTWHRRPTAIVVTLGVVATAAVVVAIMAGPAVQQWAGLGAAGDRIVASVAPVRLPILSSVDVALIRAQTLYDRGRLAEALVELDRVSLDSPQRPQADTLRLDIQRLLLASARDQAKSPRPVETPKR